MTPVAGFFSPSYAAARRQFLSAARDAGAAYRAVAHPDAGLFIDVVRDGSARAENLLIVTSGVHGIEGFVGSAVQSYVLKTGFLSDGCLSNTAVLHVHAVNPWGFAHGSRTNEDNVDLNRNGLDWTQPLPAEHPLTAEAHRLLLPDAWSWPAPGLMQFMATHAEDRAAQVAISQGQYRFADGLFYGGTGSVWSNTTWREILAEETADSARIIHVDIHSGLGPRGHGELISSDPSASASFARATRIFGGDALRSGIDGDSASVAISGGLVEAAKASAGKPYVGVTLEFGTLPVPQVLEALALDNWTRARGATPALAAERDTKMRAAFCPDDVKWQEDVMARSCQVLGQARAALAAPGFYFRP